MKMKITKVKRIILNTVLLFLVHSTSSCPAKCDCSLKTTMYCYNATIFEIGLPKSVKNVTLMDFDVSSLQTGIFKNETAWTRVEELHIYGKYGDSLAERAFDGLTNLRKLFFHHPKMTSMSSSAFETLHKLETLDLSDTIQVKVETILNSIKRAWMPRLSSVSLKGIGSFLQNSVNMDISFFRQLTRRGIRSIRHIDISNVTVGQLDLRYAVTFGLCRSLEKLIMRNCVIALTKFYAPRTQCRSLRVVDISGSFLPVMLFHLALRISNFFCSHITWLFSVEEFYMDYVLQRVHAPDLVLRNYSLHMDHCPLRIQKLSISSNTLRWIDVAVSLHAATAESLEWVDISDNQLEYIAPKFLAPSFNIKQLHLAYNRLNVMQQDYFAEFEVLLTAQTKLHFLSMVGNDLAKIPRKMFQRNRDLEYLDLSVNRLTNIDFEVQHLVNLKILNISWNKIQNFDECTRTQLEQMWTVAQNQSRTFQLDIGGNPLSCSCLEENIKFMVWIRDTAKNFLVRRNDTYICEFHGFHINILKDDLRKIHSYCEWKVTKGYVYTFVPLLSMLVCGLTVLVLVKLNQVDRRKRMKALFDRVVAKLRSNQFPKEHLAFVSFCSEDDRVVSNEILPKLQQTLQTLVNTDKGLIARGDTTFRPGFPVADEIIKSIDESAVIILVVSRNFCLKEWCQKEIKEAYDQHKPIILIMLQDVDVKLMGEVLRKIFDRYTHARWIEDGRDGGHLEPDWLRFCRVVITLAGYVNQDERLKKNNDNDFAEN